MGEYMETPTSKTFACIQMLVQLIAQTEFVDSVDDEVMTDRRIYRACLDWRLAELVEQSDFEQRGDLCH
jgi:hypothetical protein